jgi:hypothetical protein
MSGVAGRDDHGVMPQLAQHLYDAGENRGHAVYLGRVRIGHERDLHTAKNGGSGSTPGDAPVTAV